MNAKNEVDNSPRLIGDIFSSIESVYYITSYGSKYEIPFEDDDVYGDLYFFLNEFGLEGLIRVKSEEEAYEIYADTMAPDPTISDEEMIREYGFIFFDNKSGTYIYRSPIWESVFAHPHFMESYGVRPNGVPDNPNLKSNLYEISDYLGVFEIPYKHTFLFNKNVADYKLSKGDIKDKKLKRIIEFMDRHNIYIKFEEEEEEDDV